MFGSHRPLVLVTKEAILIPNLSSDYLETLRRYWRDDSGFGIPEEWMVSHVLLMMASSNILVVC